MNARDVVQILMKSPIYSRLTLPERKKLVLEFAQEYQLPERITNVSVQADTN